MQQVRHAIDRTCACGMPCGMGCGGCGMRQVTYPCRHMKLPSHEASDMNARDMYLMSRGMPQIHHVTDICTYTSYFKYPVCG